MSMTDREVIERHSGEHATIYCDGDTVIASFDIGGGESWSIHLQAKTAIAMAEGLLAAAERVEAKKRS
jgi:hypothetical protein